MHTATTFMIALTACFASAALLPARLSGDSINLAPARAPADVPAGFGTPIVRRHNGTLESAVAVGSSIDRGIAQPSGTATVDKTPTIAGVCNSIVTAATTGTPQHARLRPRWARNQKRAPDEPIYPIARGIQDSMNGDCAVAASGVAAASGVQAQGAATPTGAAGSAQATGES